MNNIAMLDAQIKAAGIAIDGLNSEGVIWFQDGVTNQQKAQAQQMFADFVANPPAPPKSQMDLVVEYIAGKSDAPAALKAAAGK